MVSPSTVGIESSNSRKVHADAAKYTPGSTKQEVYDQVLEQAEALFKGQRNWVNPLENVPYNNNCTAY